MKDRKTLLFIILLLYSAGSAAQTDYTVVVQDLRHQLDAVNQDTAKAKIYLKLGSLYSKNQYDSALNFAKLALELSLSIGYKTGILRSYVQLGTILKNKGNYRISIRYFKNALPLAHGSSDSAAILNNMGSTYLKIGRLDSALSNMLNSLKIKIRINDEAGIVNSYINLSNFHFTERQFAEAKSYCLKGLALEAKLNNASRLSKLYVNLGNVYCEMHNPDSAEFFYNKVLKSKGVETDLANFATVYLNLGNIYQSQNKLKPALAFYKKGLEINESVGDVYQTINALKNIGNIYEALKDYKKAVSYYENALEKAKNINSQDQEKALMFNLSACYEKSNNYALAFRYLQRGDTIASNLYEQERETQIAGMLAKFKTEQKEKELVQQRALNDKKSYQRNAFILTSIFLLILLGGAISIYLKARSVNHKLTSQKNIIEKREREKELLLRELHHRAKNNLQLVSSLLNLQANQLKDTDAADAVKEGQARVEAMALIHRDLYRRENVTRVNLKVYLDNMVNNLISTYNFSKSSLAITIDVTEIELEADLAIPLGLIANELISNSFKHAFAHQQYPELFIVAGEMSENELHLLIRDNGKGIQPNDASKEESFGVSMIHSLVKQLQGSITFENINGCTATLIVPLRKDELIEI